MKLIRRFHLAMLAFALLFCVTAARPSYGQEAAGQQVKEPPAHETHSENEEFRHSAAVKAIARFAHVDVETAAKIFEDLNSGILIAAILAFLLKVLPKAFRSRTEVLQKQLIEARLATTQANERLAVVEERLSKLDTEIEAVRQQAERESVEDEKRIHESLEAERQRIIASAEQEIEAAGAAARRELKNFAAELAVERATRKIQLTAEADRMLVRNFGESLIGRGERN